MFEHMTVGRGPRASARAFACIAVTIGLAACNGQAAAPGPAATAVVAPTTIHLPKPIGLGADSATLIADARGYFAQEGLAVEYVPAGDPATSMSLVLTGAVDVGLAGMDPALFNAVQRGVDLRLVAANPAAVDFMVRKDLADSGRVRTYADLKGLTIGALAHGNTSEYMVSRALQAGGLTLADANIVVLNFPAMAAALASRAIDVGLLGEPFSTATVQKGIAVKWKGYGDIVPGIQAAGLILAPQFAGQHDLAIRWMTAFLRGVRDMDDAFGKQNRRAETIQILAPALSVAPALFEAMTIPILDPDGMVNQATLEDQMHWYVQMGYLASPVDVAGVVDPSIAQAAVAKLGAYQ